MTNDPFARARQIADTVLYEGYLLYPYRASAQKNQQRFQFGVLMPPGYRDLSEQSGLQAECVLECALDTEIRVLIRFLQLQHRESDDGSQAPWDEAVEHEQLFEMPVRSLLDSGQLNRFHIDGGTEAAKSPQERGLTRKRWQLDGELRAGLAQLPGPYGALELHLRVDNATRTHSIDQRDEALRHALVAAHLIVQVPNGKFLSMVDPPEWAGGYAARCENVGVWPVLAGPAGCENLLLASPIILYDHPEVAEESPENLYDSTEIDEILLLRTLTLTDDEKVEARATDPRAAAVIDRTEALSPELLDRLHGAVRYLEEVRGPDAEPVGHAPSALLDLNDPHWPLDPAVPWWDPEADDSVSPETDQIVIAGVPVSKGSAVLMRPGARRADAQDLFLVGRPAVVEAVLTDVDGNVHLAVTPQDDPDADLRSLHGRFLYFAPDEVEPIGEQG